MIDGWEVPTGRKLEDSTRPKDWFGSINVSPTADDDRAKLARRYFAEASADDFEIDGKEWIDKQSLCAIGSPASTRCCLLTRRTRAWSGS